MNSSVRDENANPADRTIRVAIADGRSLIAAALRRLIEGLPGFVVTDTVSWESTAALDAARDVHLVLVGVGDEVEAAMEFIRLLRLNTDEPQVVILADRPNPSLLRLVLDQRLNGLLTTQTTVRDFAASLDQVARGHAVLPAGWQQMLDSDTDRVSALSVRQLEVLKLLSEGCSYEQIATRLFISVNTVKFHVRTIFSQLGVRNRVAAARLLAQAPPQLPSLPQVAPGCE